MNRKLRVPTKDRYRVLEKDSEREGSNGVTPASKLSLSCGQVAPLDRGNTRIQREGLEQCREQGKDIASNSGACYMDPRIWLKGVRRLHPLPHNRHRKTMLSEVTHSIHMAEKLIHSYPYWLFPF